jgi:polysaccharide pyruvyl transferase WcaK-like protein
MNIFIGFSFYGAGNIGDDLMLQGFVDGVLDNLGDHCNIFCCISKDRIASQQLRFPAISWVPDIMKERLRLLNISDFWLGVGGTPFQGSSGDWLLEQIAFDLDHLHPSTTAVMLGVGAETEVLRYSNLVSKICNRLNTIFTRDISSADILLNGVGVTRSKVKSAGDLAHPALKSLFPGAARRGLFKTGICFYQEKCSRDTLRSLRAFVNSKGDESRVVFFANETRLVGFERTLYYRMYPRHLLRFWLNNDRPVLLIPRYEVSSIEQLVSHFQQFNIVLASRYHALLTAAWAGCHVVALGRSSKITTLAVQLDIPLVHDPYDLSQLHAAFHAASRVNRDKLETLRDATLKSCADVVQLIESQSHRKCTS